MNVQTLSLNRQSKLINDYRNRDESIFTQFHYDPYQLRSYRKRYDYLVQQEYKRDHLADVLLKQNRQWGMSKQAEDNIEKIRQKDSVVVIGGQQAGLLTGPMYTINKIISIIIQTKEQSEHLQKPVIPVFWIAGEDHDFEEINHIFTYYSNQLKKEKVKAKHPEKTPVSNREIDSNELKDWLDRIFLTLQETQYTKKLYDELITAIEQSTTYVDFFANIIHRLFRNEGLVLVDSNHEGLRELEKDYMIQLIEKQQPIAESVVRQLQHQEDKGYSIALDATTEDGHLFYHLNGERLLLEKRDEDWVSKDEQVRFTQSELIELVHQDPRCFSNNVVTRPMMQEMVFPVLSFIGGPGEIAYWSVLKESFESLDLQFPIITPRISMTLLTSNQYAWMQRYGLTLETVINHGTYQEKMNWLKRQTQAPIDEVIDNIKQELTLIHQPIQDVASTIQDDLETYAQSNLVKMQEELDDLNKRLTREVKRKNQHTLKCFDEIQHYYYPFNGLQERTWNVVYFLNYFGLDLPEQLLTVPPHWEQDHIVVEI
ncbi:bacillithiol biosynthesis cysteine-adding enzyme BshC [Tenuibacillus multivorans]|uniref:Putative cysteine ligase BshC n=1 Tax=Tenuibacillus multivorans TaxID=237069 RepID=A0A1G9Y7A7_9BACI|nr:bacillithiol biosynthesis cysteine-adding enzyme BshC [Tenuibacillus multivorans]GEL75976.1 putative cysteine ligase BshC [Tenuibacillus multivorans]SDN04948.1 bacillithiol biosynthesis cysteine-adding enzyme BshC [Tenuibacillus multivorans]